MGPESKLSVARYVQISGIKLYRQEESSSPDEILMECDFMWSGQQVCQKAPFMRP